MAINVLPDIAENY